MQSFRGPSNRVRHSDFIGQPGGVSNMDVKVVTQFLGEDSDFVARRPTSETP